MPVQTKAATEDAFADPQPGDEFHELYSFWIVVITAAPGGGPVEVITLSPGARGGVLPDDGKLRLFGSAHEFRTAYGYPSGRGYWVRLSERGVDVTGWRTAATSHPFTSGGTDLASHPSGMA